MERYCRVAIDSPVSALDRPFDYEIPERLRSKVDVGSVVRVVLHGRGMRAFVTELLDRPAVEHARPLRSVVASDPLFSTTELELARWTARRYLVPLGRVLHEAVPGRFSAPRREAKDAPAAIAPWAPSGRLATLVADRRTICVFPPSVRDEDALADYVARSATISGGRTLVICPRVDLAERVASRIGGAVVLHGEERPGERAAAWAAARDGQASVVVGGRSALFVPLPDLAAVLVLSAHDRSLKAERAPRLHALVVARKRAELAGAAFVASSPAPPVELAAAVGIEWVTEGRSRVRTEVARPRSGPVTPRLIQVVRSTVGAGRDALVFVGRVGNALRLRCLDCGWTPSCPECRSGLAQGGEPGELVCRVCGRRSGTPATCASCGGALAERGWGHERVARALEREDVGAPVLRAVRGSLPSDRPKPSVLVGTLAAAHAGGDFGCVCVADVDQLLARPDFRASEHALQTLYELAGSLASDGRFLLQTREPEHHAVQAFTRQSYRYFFDRELAFRIQTGYPPFGVVVRVEASPEVMEHIRPSVVAAGGDLVGSIERGKRLTSLIRAKELEPLLEPLKEATKRHPRTRIDVDPTDVI